MAQTPSVWERQPYRVAVCLDVTAAAAQRLSPQKNVELVAAMENHITQWKSPYWVWQKSPDTISSHDTAILVENFLRMDTGFLAEDSPELLALQPLRQCCDKLFIIQISYISRTDSSDREARNGGIGGFRIAVREWDTMAGILGDTLVVPVFTENFVTPILMAMETVFAPVAKITTIGSSEVTLVPLAAELATLSVFYTGDLLIPFVRVTLRDNPTGQIRQITWTCLMVRNTTPEFVAAVETGAANPLITRSGGRAESFAIRPYLQPRDVLLQVTFRSTAEKFHTTPRYEIVARNTTAETPNFVSLGTTDLRGRFLLKYHTDMRNTTEATATTRTEMTDTEKFRMIYVRQGRSSLAKLPVIFGWQSKLAIPVADDTNRLGAEAVLWDIQQRALDIAAQQELLNIPIPNDMDVEKIREIVAVRQVQQNNIPTMATVLMQLEIERLKWKSDDPAVQKRITAMFKETEMVIRKTLQPM